MHQTSTKPAPWIYLFSVIAWSCVFLGFVALTNNNLFSIPAILGLLGPLIIPNLLITIGYRDPSLDKSAKDFLIRSINPRTLTFKWYLITVGLILVMIFLPVLIDSSVEELINVGPPFFLIIGVLAGAVEEPGWRGYAQEGLQRRMPVLAASLVIGIFWSFWHLPLFLISETYQAELGIGTIDFWFFHLAILIESPIYAWLYNASGRVIFAVVLYHGLGNLVHELVPEVSTIIKVGMGVFIALLLTLSSWKWMSQRRSGNNTQK